MPFAPQQHAHDLCRIPNADVGREIDFCIDSQLGSFLFMCYTIRFRNRIDLLRISSVSVRDLSKPVKTKSEISLRGKQNLVKTKSKGGWHCFVFSLVCVCFDSRLCTDGLGGVGSHGGGVGVVRLCPNGIMNSTRFFSFFRSANLPL